jgi:uncharacterized protein with predicted RNA binding PUA domain
MQLKIWEKYWKQVVTIADFQFGKGVGEKLFPKDEIEFVLGNTKKIRKILRNNEVVATLRPEDGLLVLSFYGAELLHQILPNLRYRVKVKKEAVPFIAQGYNVLANQIEFADEEILPREEVIVLDPLGRVIAVGDALLNGKEMYEFNYGVAIKVRKSLKDKLKKLGKWNSNWSDEEKRQKIMEFLKLEF